MLFVTLSLTYDKVVEHKINGFTGSLVYQINVYILFLCERYTYVKVYNVKKETIFFYTVAIIDIKNKCNVKIHVYIGNF